MSSKVSIVIVEDHAMTLEGIVAGLAREEDMDVVGTATDSESGLALARKTHPDIILLDLHLPDSDKPVAMLQAFCQLGNSRVIVLTGDDRQAFVQIVLSNGASGYLLKSESAKAVANAVRQVMSGKGPVLSAALRPNITKLTRAEQQLLKMLARGMKYQDIADRRYTTIATVRRQTETLLLKVNVGTREELIAWAVYNGYGHLELET